MEDALLFSIYRVLDEGFQKDLKSNRLIISLVIAPEVSLQPVCLILKQRLFVLQVQMGQELKPDNVL